MIIYHHILFDFILFTSLHSLTSRQSKLSVYTDELLRWTYSQTNPKHPNGGQVVMLWNVLANQCDSIRQAAMELEQLQIAMRDQSFASLRSV